MARLVVESVAGNPPRVESRSTKGSALIIPEGFAGGPPAIGSKRSVTPGRWHNLGQSIR